MKKIKAFWESLDESTVISKRELFLGLSTCALAGIVLGLFLSPKKTVTIGSHNGNNNNGNGCDNVAEGNLEGDLEEEEGKDTKPVKSKK